MTNARNRIVLWDLDGTLYRSMAGYRFFAICLAEALTPQDRASYLARTEQYLRGTMPEGASGFSSDWDAMIKLALPFLDGDEGTLARMIQEAFARLRPYLLNEAPDIRPDPRVRSFLKAARRHARLAVVTNAPAQEANPRLERLGIADLFAAVIADAGKPDGLLSAQSYVAALEPQVDAVGTLSVGDNWANDIVPALSQGWNAAYVRPIAGLPVRPEHATWEGGSLDELLPDIAHWLVEGRPQERVGPNTVDASRTVRSGLM